MELWDIYDADKKVTGRTMKRNDWCLKDGEYHLTVLGVIARPDHTYLITKRVMTKAWAPGWWEVSGGARTGGRNLERGRQTGSPGRNRIGCKRCCPVVMHLHIKEKIRERETTIL